MRLSTINGGLRFNQGKQVAGFTFEPTQGTGSINWAQFPNFTIDTKTIVYDGVFSGSSNDVLGKGFTHISSFATDAAGRAALSVSQRAHPWYSIVSISPDQPWEVNPGSFDHNGRCPWGNDLNVYRAKWLAMLDNQAAIYYGANGFPPVDLIVMDIEAMYPWPRREIDILALRGTSGEPIELQGVSDAEFVDEYKREMARLYREPLLSLRGTGFAGKVGSFNDAPWQNYWYFKNDYASWAEMVDPNNWDPVQYTTLDPESPTPKFGPMHDDISPLTPSAYCPLSYEDQAVSTAGDYLAGLMAQVELNRARTDKDLVIFVWLDQITPVIEERYPMRPHQAEAMGIFLWFGHVDGLWLWDNGHTIEPSESYAKYEWFVYGLYRFSQWPAYHNRNLTETYVADGQDPYTLMAAGNEGPIWRGLIRPDLGTMLIAAQHPYQDEDGTSFVMNVDYEGHQIGSVTLKNRETVITEFDLSQF